MYTCRFIDKSHNGAASVWNGQHLGALGHATDGRSNYVKVTATGSFVVRCLWRGGGAIGLTTARYNLILNRRTRCPAAGGQRWARRDCQWASIDGRGQWWNTGCH